MSLTDCRCAVVTSSHQRSRIESYLSAADIRLTPDEVRDIDDAGRKAVFRAKSWAWARTCSRFLLVLLALVYWMTRT